LKCQLGDK